MAENYTQENNVLIRGKEKTYYMINVNHIVQNNKKK